MNKRAIFRAHVLSDQIAGGPMAAVTNEDVRRFQVRLTKRTHGPRRRSSRPGSINNVMVELAVGL